jgi:hypothetical protein
MSSLQDVAESGLGPDSTVTRSPRAVFRRLADEEGGVLLHLDTAAYHGLNEMGSLIWELIGDRGTVVSVLVAELKAHLDDAPPDLVDHVVEFLDALRERGLVSTGAAL